MERTADKAVFDKAADALNRLTSIQDREFAVVGNMMHGRDTTEDVLRLAGREDFTHGPARLVFDACRAIYDSGRAPSMAGVLQYVIDLDRKQDFGAEPATFLYDLFSYWAPTDMDLPLHLENLRRDAKLRQMQQIGHEVQHATVEPFDAVDDMAHEFARRLEAVATARTVTDPVPVSTLHLQAQERYDSLAAGGRPPSLPTGITALDQVLGGFSPGTLSVLAARPSVGKSALALCFAANVARWGRPVLFFSLEMSCDEVFDRLAAMTADIPLSQLRGGSRMEVDAAAKIVRLGCEDGLATYPIYFDDRAGLTVSQLALTAKRHCRRHGTKLVVVDYLQLLRAENPKEPRYLQIGQMTKAMKELAKTTRAAVLCLAQLNRETEAGGQDGRPRLSQLRDSGEIEQDADVVMFLHRLQADPMLPAHDIDLIVAKQRNGPVGDVPLTYVRAYTRFAARHTVPL